jgi:pyridoxal phosphate enzyme (YggS family)
VQILHDLGVENFGENRSSEGLDKSFLVDARWHYQGQVQSKKIREISGWADCIHSLDNLGHAEKFSRTLDEMGESREFFLQLSLDGDPERGGLVEAELFATASSIQELPGITMMGIMCVPPVEMPVDQAFSKIQKIHQKFIDDFPDSPSLSAGMSGDYLIALHHGATHVRVGSKILGHRLYH